MGWTGMLKFLACGRPLVLGQRVNNARIEYCIASEDCAFGPIGFERVRDINPGEMLVRIRTLKLPCQPYVPFTSTVSGDNKYIFQKGFV